MYFDYDGIIKLCFIGFKSKTFYGKFTIKQIEKSSLKSPFNYIPQECRRISVKTKKVDIFDFGLVALEIATKPLENFSVHYTPYTLCQTLKDADIMVTFSIYQILNFFEIEREFSISKILNLRILIILY